MAFPTNPTDKQRYGDYVYDSTLDVWEYSLDLDGSTELRAAPSGNYLAQNFSLSSGWYWIKAPSMPSALQMYVDMTEEGGGFDFYPIQGDGTSFATYNDPHSGDALGLDIVYTRSQAHWRAIYNFINGVLGENPDTYFQCLPVYSLTKNANVPDGTYTSNANGNYTSYIINSTGTPDWRVKDGGRWWLDNSPFDEPNGDYTFGRYLELASYTINSDGTLSGFNDQPSSDPSGGYYLLSTNAKP